MTLKKPNFFRPTSDVGFAKLFGKSGDKDLLLQLLNSVIPDRHITDVERMDTTHRLPNDASCRFDIYCKCEDGEHIIVEMQNASHSASFIKRSLIYSALAMQDQAAPNWNYAYKKVYFVGLLNYVQFSDRKPAITRVSLQSEDDHLIVNEDFLQIFIELPKLAAKEQVGRLTSASEKFLCAIRDIGKAFDERPDEYQDPLLDKLFRQSHYNLLTNDEEELYRKSMTTLEDYRAYYEEQIEIATARMKKQVTEQVTQQVTEQVTQQVAQARDTAIARLMLADGVPPENIAKWTGLSLEDVSSLASGDN